MLRGDYQGTEELIVKSSEQGVFSKYMSSQQPRSVWTPLILPEDSLEAPTPPPEVTAPPGEEREEEEEEEEEKLPLTQPTARGGHQLVMDPGSQMIYLFGGWDGNRDLSDFWAYNVALGKWTLISADTEADGGPPSRSCHKMVVDPVYRQIFVLGRYLERGLRDLHTNIKSDFYVYDIGSNTWTQITDDTAALGGPSLIFDHQMCLDSDTRCIYVFGGQSLHVTEEESRPAAEKKFSGLYVYCVANNTWRLIAADGAVLSPGVPPVRLVQLIMKRRLKIMTSPPTRSRTGHSMLWNTTDRRLYVFGGQRKRDEYLHDFFSYSPDTGEVKT